MSTPECNNGISTRDLCFIDVETTGTVFGFHEIIDIGAIRTLPDGSELLGIWHARVMPRHPERISESARELNGFNRGTWSTARSSDEALWKEFARFARRCVPVCHNPSFDRAFISIAAAAEGVEDLGLDYHWIGTETLAWPLLRAGIVSKLSLASLCDALRIESESLPHSALGGAHACRRVYITLMSLLSHRIGIDR